MEITLPRTDFTGPRTVLSQRTDGSFVVFSRLDAGNFVSTGGSTAGFRDATPAEVEAAAKAVNTTPDKLLARMRQIDADEYDVDADRAEAAARNNDIFVAERERRIASPGGWHPPLDLEEERREGAKARLDAADLRRSAATYRRRAVELRAAI